MTHPELVAALAKPGADILASLTPEKCHLLHMAYCIGPEAGELADAVKKHIFYEGAINRENVIEELGDIEFYLEGLRQGLGITREETLQENIRKLSIRYQAGADKVGYSNDAAHRRADKIP